MNRPEDSLTVVTDLRSARLDRLTEDGYARRRAGDLVLGCCLGRPARALATAISRSSGGRVPGRGQRRSRPYRRRGRGRGEAAVPSSPVTRRGRVGSGRGRGGAADGLQPSC